MFVMGILPALLLLYVRRWVDEPTLWIAADRCRREARTRVEVGSGSPQDRELAQFTLSRIVSDPELRRRVGVLLVMSITTVVGWWSASTWIPDYARAQSHLSPSLVGLIFSTGPSRVFLHWVYWPTSWVASQQLGCITWEPWYSRYACFCWCANATCFSL